jgi:hypothetical protein
MDLLPLYDDTKPITCTADAEEIPARIEQVERMRDHLERIERTPYGLLLHFPDRKEIDACLRRFVVDEKRCCEFWGFDIQRDGGHIRLRWDGPPTVHDFFRQLLEYFESDQPITAFSGLL